MEADKTYDRKSSSTYYSRLKNVYFRIEVDEGGVTWRYTVGQRLALPPTEVTAEVSRLKVEAEGGQRHPLPKVLKLKKGSLF